MTVTTLDPSSALVVIDLQHGIVALPTAHPADAVVATAARLAREFRAARRPVVFARLVMSPDFGDVLHPRADAPLGGGDGPPPANFSELVPELDVQPQDLQVDKRGWSAFHGTDLDLRLRRRGITNIVLAGIATSLGVESTARGAFERGYNLTLVRDALTDPDPQAHDVALDHVLPHIAEVDSADAILAHLNGA